MDHREKSMVDLLASNRAVVSGAFKLRGAADTSLAALVWTLAERRADAKQMRTSLDYLKGVTSTFSSARTRNMLPLVSHMAMSGNNKAYFSEVQHINEKIMEGKLVETDARFSTALIIANSTQTPEEADRLLERSQRIFSGMREAHPLITDERSLPFAAIIALTESDEEELLADAEACYGLLSKGYGLTGRRTMANILAISTLPPQQKIDRVEKLRSAFKANKIPIGWSSIQEYSMLALLALDDRPASAIAEDVAEVDKYLKKQKGFGDFSLDRAFRLLFASAISTYSHQESTKVGAVADRIAAAVAQALSDWYVYCACTGAAY